MMKRWIALLCVGIGMFAPSLTFGQDAPDAANAEAQTDQDLAAQLKENPDDQALFNKYVGQNLNQIQRMAVQDPDQAEKQLGEMKTLLESLEPTTDPGKRLVAQGVRFVEMFRQQLAVARVTLDELTKQLQEDANDAETISLFARKLGMEISPLARSEPEKAEQMLKSAQQLFASLQEQAEQEDAKQALQSIDRTISALEQQIEAGKKLAALVGAEAAPLKVEAWVNGKPLTDEDLEGKVVLLDFWAVWCGPCVATFPHLREWHEQYADKGLVIIGLTGYFNYIWDEEKETARRATGDKKVTPEEEQEMLEKFAEHHNLQHRFAIPEGNTLSEYYLVSGIPHVVIIDREGKIQLVRIGSGEQTTEDISEMLAKLFNDS